MKEKMPGKVKFKFYEYPLYWLVTLILFVLAVPIVVGKFIAWLIRSTGAPLKSAGNFIGFVIVLLIIAGGFVTYKIFIPYNIGGEVKSITVKKNDTFLDVFKDLKNNDILKDARVFRLMSVATGLDKSIAPGRYDFSGQVSLYSIMNKLKRQDISTLFMTIPEGLTVWETASIVSKYLEIDSAAFVALAFDTAHTRDKYNLDGLEGHLFPETYRLSYETGLDEIIDIMIDEFNRQTSGLFDTDLPNGLSGKDIVTLASIIEAEAHDGSELTLISSVYHNRLKKRMRLQADPTVIYAIGGLDRPLWYRDLEYDSPYNTYKYGGLPPGPINSPGLAAIEAAANPDSSNYLYFVADGTGRHIFSETLREHNRAKNRIKKEQKNTKSG